MTVIQKKLTYFSRYAYWLLSKSFIHLYIRPKFNIVKEKGSDPIPKPPFIMISNHGTFFDPWIVGQYCHYPMSIMMNEDGFKTGAITRWYLSKVGTFPKKKGASDYRAMKTILKTLSDGYSVMIFPEGQTTWDGETQPIFPGVEKIIKRAKVSLVMMRVKGDFLSKPWWADTYRKGKVRILQKALNPDKINLLSEHELLIKMKDHIYNNDIKDKENSQTEFTGKDLAGGLERFVWICKNCKKEDMLVTKGNHIICSACNCSWSMDTHFRFKPLQADTAAIGDLHDWAKWHKEMVMDKIKSGGLHDTLTESNDVRLCTISDDGKTTNLATGTLSLTKEFLTFNPAMDSPYTIQLSVPQIHGYVFQRKDIFECRCNDKSYRFRFKGHSQMKWVYYLRYLNGYEEYEQRGYL